MSRHRRKSKWSRRSVVGIRIAGLLTLVLGVAGGMFLDYQNDRRSGATFADGRLAAEQAEQELLKDHLAETELERARIAAEEAARAKAAAEATRQDRTPEFGPIPASCQVYKNNRAIGCTLMLEAGYDLDQMPCLDKLWTKESGWNHLRKNTRTGAYGIPQALPGSKMKSAGADWEYNPATQVEWGLKYIRNMYDTPCGAWQNFLDEGWY